jgi:hypothetical protein
MSRDSCQLCRATSHLRVRHIHRLVSRGVFKSVKDLNTKIRAFIDGWNDRSHPVVWTKTAEQILANANRPTALSSRH